MKFRLRLLIVAFTVSFLLVGTLSTISYIRFSQLNERADWVGHSYKVSHLIGVLNNDMQEMDKAYFRYLITYADSFRTRFVRVSLTMMSTTDSLKQLSSDNKYQQQLLVLFTSDLFLYLRESQRTLSLPAVRNTDSALADYNRSKYLSESALAHLSSMTVAEDMLLHRRNDERIIYGHLTGELLKALSLVFGVVSLILFFFLLHEFRIRVLFQRQLQQKMAELAQSKHELEHIAYATSHDLQEPLRKIRILADRWKIQQKAGADPGTSDTLERIDIATTKMQALVTDLMVLTSLKEGEILIPCDLDAFVQNAVAMAKEAAPERKIIFMLEDLPMVNGHPDQLRLLFKNLLDNAMKFSRPGVTPEIKISCAKTNGEELGMELDSGHEYYCISIEDNGMGFDNKLTSRMFGIFRQLHSPKDGFGGKGTGLAICHRIMNNHKGGITAHGFPGAGATFKLYFPVSNVGA